MTYRIVPAVAMLVCGLSGCAPTMMSLNPSSSPNQKIVYEDGLPIVMSVKSSAVALYPATRTFAAKSGPRVAVKVTNGTKQPVEFSTDNITASAGKAPVRVKSYEELVAEQEAQKRSANNAAMMAAIMGGMGQMVGQRTNDLAFSQSQLQASQTIASSTQQQLDMADSTISELTKSMLKRQTVMPGATYGGYVQLDKVDGFANEPLAITVDFGGEVHQFSYALKEQ